MTRPSTRNEIGLTAAERDERLRLGHWVNAPEPVELPDSFEEGWLYVYREPWDCFYLRHFCSPALVAGRRAETAARLVYPSQLASLGDMKAALSKASRVPGSSDTLEQLIEQEEKTALIFPNADLALREPPHGYRYMGLERAFVAPAREKFERAADEYMRVLAQAVRLTETMAKPPRTRLGDEAFDVMAYNVSEWQRAHHRDDDGKLDGRIDWRDLAKLLQCYGFDLGAGDAAAKLKARVFAYRERLRLKALREKLVALLVARREWLAARKSRP